MNNQYAEAKEAVAYEVLPPESSQPSVGNPHQLVARGVGQVFGLHPAIAVLTVAVDAMVFSGDIASVGIGVVPLSLAAGGILGCITYMAQKKWYGDDNESAAIKALILAFLTAIPTSLPNLLFVPAGLVGLVHTLRRR